MIIILFVHLMILLLLTEGHVFQIGGLGFYWILARLLFIFLFCFDLEHTLNKCYVCKNSESRGQNQLLVRIIVEVEVKDKTVEIV